MSPKINKIGFGSHGHVRKSENHENDGFSGSPKRKLKRYLKVSPLLPAALAVAGFLVAGLVAWQYYEIRGFFVVWFLFC